MNIPYKKFLSVSEVAQILGISRMHVLRKIKTGELVAEKIGKSYIIFSSSLPGLYQPITQTGKKKIKKIIDETMKEYGEVIRKLGHV